MYEQTRDVLKASHTYDNVGSEEWNKEVKDYVAISKRVPTNLPLEQQIKVVEQEAVKNYEDNH